MKKPRKPTPPTPLIRPLCQWALPTQGRFIHLSELLPTAVEKAAKSLKLDKKDIVPECCFWKDGVLYYNFGMLPQELIVKTTGLDADLENAKIYKKKMESYQKKLRQYHINMDVYNAWKLKEKKDKILEQMKSLQQELAILQNKVDLVDQSIEKAVGNETE